LAPIALLLRSSPDEAIRDGYGRNFCIAIDPRAVIAYNGQNLPYHPVAIVSGGPNAQVEAGTTFVGGQLTLAGDDVGMVVDTAGQAISAYAQTMIVLAPRIGAMQQYFSPVTTLIRHGRPPSTTSVAVPRLARREGFWWVGWRQWHPTTCAAPVGMDTTVAGVIGLTRQDITDGYGQIFNTTTVAPACVAPAMPPPTCSCRLSRQSNDHPTRRYPADAERCWDGVLNQETCHAIHSPIDSIDCLCLVLPGLGAGPSPAALVSTHAPDTGQAEVKSLYRYGRLDRQPQEGIGNRAP